MRSVISRHSQCKRPCNDQMNQDVVDQSVLDAYRKITNEIDVETQRLQAQIGGSPCPINCYDCCHNTATMTVSGIEARDLKIGLQKLPKEIQSHILEKADKSIIKLEATGVSEENISETSSMNMPSALKGSPEGACPMLVSGVCTVYNHRPIICRVWGYPIKNKDKTGCCWKTFIGQRTKHAPIQYNHYWEECRDLSRAIGNNSRTPNCYLVKRLLS